MRVKQRLGHYWWMHLGTAERYVIDAARFRLKRNGFPYWELKAASAHDVAGIPGDDQLLVGRDDKDLDLGVGREDR